MTESLSEIRQDKQRHAEEHVKKAGYASGGHVSDESQDRKMITKAVHEHEEHDHPGKKETKLKIKAGGKVHGMKPKERMDRRARGGETSEHKGGKKGGHTHINIMVGKPDDGGDDAKQQLAMQQGMQQGKQQGVKLGMALGAKQAGGGGPPMGAPPPHPPMGGPPPGGMPPGGPMGAPGGMPPRPMPPGGGAGATPPFAKGGAVKEMYDGERGHEKIKVRAHERRKSGGEC